MGLRSRKVGDLFSLAALIGIDNDLVTVAVNLGSSIWPEQYGLVVEGKKIWN